MKPKFRDPEKSMSDHIRDAARIIRGKSHQERIDLMVRAGLVTKEEADAAKERLSKKKD